MNCTSIENAIPTAIWPAILPSGCRIGGGCDALVKHTREFCSIPSAVLKLFSCLLTLSPLLQEKGEGRM